MVRSAAARVLVVLSGLAVACSSGNAEPTTRPNPCGAAAGTAHVVLEGGRFGGWELIVTDGRDGWPYGLALDGPAVGSGCGAGPPGAPLSTVSGGGRWQGEDVVFVYGAVLPPVETITVAYEGGLTVDLRPRAVQGVPYRFFAHVSGGTGPVNVSALDAAGQLVA